MPGEQLMCVWQAVHAKDVFPESGVKRITVMSVTETFKDAPNARYSESKFLETFTESKVEFRAYKDYVINWLRAPGAPFPLLLDELESLCWEMSRSVYESEALNSDEIHQLWCMFNRLCTPGTYPPETASSDIDWFFTMIAKNLGKTWNSKASLPAQGVGFQQMINILDKTFFTVTSSMVVRDAITDLHDWIVREVMKSGWLHKRTRKQSNWTNWLRRWFVITPGKITYYDTDKEKHVKGEIVIDANSVLENLDAFKSIFNKMENRFRVKQGPHLEIEMNAESLVEKREWMRHLQNNVEAMRSGLTPVMRLLKERNNAHQTSPVTSDQKIEESIQITRAATKRVRSKVLEDVPVKQAATAKKTEVKLPLPPPNEEEEVYDNNAEDLQKEKIQVVFQQIDKDGNGKIDKNEFYNFIKTLGASVDQRETNLIFDTVDKDKNGFIYFNEFYDFFMKLLLGQIEDTAGEARLRAAFMKADRDGSGAVNFREFAEYALSKRRSMAMSKLLQAFDEIDLEGKGELTFEEFRNFFGNQLSVHEDPVDGNSNLEQYLKGFYNQTDAKEMARFLRDRWVKFASFRRVGGEGHVVMTGGHGMVADIVPGEYDLLNLACFNDLPPIVPKHVDVKVTWTKSTVPGKSGRCVFPADFDGVLPIEIATNEHLAFYGAALADGQQLKVSLLYRHGIQDFTYENSYLDEYVTNEKALGGAGIEKHDFHHLDCPLEEDSGNFIMGKLDDDGTLHLTAFKVPTRHTLYIPGGVIHSNDYLKGTWRTMLSDEAEINHVQLVKIKREGSMELHEHFTFKFK